MIKVPEAREYICGLHTSEIKREREESKGKDGKVVEDKVGEDRKKGNRKLDKKRDRSQGVHCYIKRKHEEFFPWQLIWKKALH